MIKITLYIVGFLFSFNTICAQIVNIPDANFKAKLLSSYPGSGICENLNFEDVAIDTNQDGEIQLSEAFQIKIIIADFSNIQNVEGIEAFINLDLLNLHQNQIVSLINLPASLRVLFCNNNQINLINLLECPNLQVLNCSFNNLDSLNVSGCPNLAFFYCGINNLNSLDVSGHVYLKELSCYDNIINNINLSGCTALQDLNCDNNQLNSLDISSCLIIQFLHCQNNDFVSIDLSNKIYLQELYCTNNLINSLNINNCFNLLILNCSINLITNLILPGNNLKELNCSSNYITSLNTSNQPNLRTLNCSGCAIQTLDLSNNSLLNLLQLNNNNLSNLIVKNINFPTSISISNNPNLSYICSDSNDVIYFQNMVTNLGYTNCVVNSNCALSTSDITSKQSVILFPNPVISTLNIDTKAIIESITIYNSLGQFIKKTSLDGNIKRIEIEDLMIGNYFVKIVFEDGETLIQKIVKE